MLAVLSPAAKDNLKAGLGWWTGSTALPVLCVVQAAAPMDILRLRGGSSVYLAHLGPLAQPQSWRALRKDQCWLPAA